MENDEQQVVTPEENNEEVEINLEEEVTEPEMDWKAEALKYKAIAQRLKKKESSQPETKQDLPAKTDDTDIRKTVESLALAEKKRQFGYEHGLSPEETDAVFKINPNPTKEVLEDPFVKGGIAHLRAKKRVADNTPSSSNRSGRTFAVKSDATPAEKQAEHDRWTQEWLSKRK